MQASRDKATSDPHALAEQLGEFTRRLFLDPRSDHLGAIEQHDLTLTQVRALLVLASCDEAISAGALAEQLGLSPAAITRALDTLVRRKLATRRECTDDRRVRLVQIAKRGAGIVDELMALRNAGLERFVADLEPARREQLSAALAAIANEAAK